MLAPKGISKHFANILNIYLNILNICLNILFNIKVECNDATTNMGFVVDAFTVDTYRYLS